MGCIHFLIDGAVPQKNATIHVAEVVCGHNLKVSLADTFTMRSAEQINHVCGTPKAGHGLLCDCEAPRRGFGSGKDVRAGAGGRCAGCAVAPGG